MPAKRKTTIYFVGWNGKLGVCIQPFFRRKDAIRHGSSCDYDRTGFYLVELLAAVIPVTAKSTSIRLERSEQ